MGVCVCVMQTGWWWLFLKAIHLIEKIVTTLFQAVEEWCTDMLRLLIPGRPVFTAGESSCVHSQEDKATFLPPAPLPACRPPRGVRDGAEPSLCRRSALRWALSPPRSWGPCPALEALELPLRAGLHAEVMPSETGQTWVWAVPCSLPPSCIWLRRRKEKFYVVFRPTGKAAVQLFICFLVPLFSWL